MCVHTGPIVVSVHVDWPHVDVNRNRSSVCGAHVYTHGCVRLADLQIDTLKYFCVFFVSLSHSLTLSTVSIIFLYFLKVKFFPPCVSLRDSFDCFNTT